jgi:CheY-like chemotaxis protein
VVTQACLARNFFISKAGGALLPDHRHFVRRPYEANQELIVSHCTVCHGFVGAAPSYPLLKLMEDLHECAQGAPPPAQPGEADKTLSRRRSNRRRSSRPVLQPRMSNPALGAILLIEDEPADTLLIRRGFEKAGVENPIQAIANGDTALAYLEGIGEYQDRTKYPLPIFVLLDLKLPGMMGLQLLKWIRSKKELRLIPVVVLTGSPDDANVKAAYEAGANSYLLKPVDRHEISRVVGAIQNYWLEHNVTPALVLKAKKD